ncbi:MAG: ATP-binding protein [Methanophagales archaeon]|nr:ATP-binding protein [Methanophagales archaeon]
MEREVIARYILDFQERKLPELISRELKISITKDAIVSIIGPRRAGKTFYFYQLMSNINEKDKNRILYLDFEYPELAGITFKEIKEIVNMHRELFGNEPEYLFFDEIQNIENWEKPIRSLYELKRFYIFITGSSSRLLSKEIATALRGRTISYTLFPFSFREYLKAGGFEVHGKYRSSYEESMIKHFIREYTRSGGLPQVVLNKDEEFRKRFFNEYLDLVVYRDIIERYGVKNLHIVKVMREFLISSFAKEFSIHRFYNTLKSQSIKVSKKTLYNYFAYFEDALFVYPIHKFSYSIKEVQLSVPKVYITDTGLLTRTMGFSGNVGRLMENVVAIELLRRKSYFAPSTEIYYYKSSEGKEVDFVVKQGLETKQLIQVCYDIADLDTRERELKSLVKASKELKSEDLSVITWDYEAEEEYKGKRIKFTPLWKWLLL